MEGILKLLRKLGYSEDEIKTVLNKVPVNQEGLTGTNVATGIFSKPKKGELAKDFLVSDTIGNPFEVNYFKGRSEKDILISAEAQLKMIDEELTKLTDQLLNKNLQLSEAQQINFAKNLETRKRFKKDFEAFKTKPEAEVLNIKTGETVTDLKKLMDEQGTKNPPTTVAGQLETTGKRLEQKGKELEEVTKPKSVIGDIMRDYSDFNKYMQSSQKTGYVRATVRQIMREDIQAGKLKLSKELQDQVMQGTGEPIDVYRKVYGEGALEQIDNLADDLGQFRTEEEAAKFARSKYTIEPKTKPVDESISYEELEDIFKKDPNKPEGKANGGAMGLDYLTGQEPPKNGYAGGGRIGFEKGTVPRMLKFLIDKLADEKDFNRKLLERSNPKAVQDLYIEKYGKLPSAEEIKDIVNKQLQNKGSMEVTNLKTGEVTTPKEPVKVTEEPRTLGGLPIDERSANISDEIDKLRASGINSLENEKKLNRLSLEFVDSLDPGRRKKALDYRRKSLDTENKLIIKAEEEGLDFDTYEKLRQGLYGPRKQQTLDFIKTGKVNIEPVKPVTTFKETQNRFKTAAKAADEIFPNYNQPKTAASELAEVMAEQKYGKVFDDLSGDQQQELYEEAYNYITSVNKLPKRAPENMLTPPVAKENKPIEGGFSFNDPDIKAQMEEAMTVAKKRGDEMRAMGLDPASGRDYDKYIEIKTKSGDKDFNKYFDDLEIKTKFKGVISDDLLNQILIDDNPQRKAEVIATIEQGLTMQEKGMSPEEIVNILKNTTRTKQAQGGRIGFEKGSIPEEEDEEPSEEYIKSREAGRSKYSFDVQGPDSRTRKSGLPGRTNPKDYGLGITYLSNSGNETAPEIRVGGSRRGVGVEIRKRFKEGGLGYLVGE